MAAKSTRYFILGGNFYIKDRHKDAGDIVGIQKDVLKNLNKGPRTYEGLKQAFPNADMARILIEMEEHHLVENRRGAWFITQKGKDEIRPGREMAVMLLVVPAICFFLLSAHYYTGYTDVQEANVLLLNEKTQTEEELSAMYEQREAAESAYSTVLDTLEEEQEKTSQLKTSYSDMEGSVDSLEQEVSYYECLETCSPDKFVTVDNPYVISKVDEITAGLTTLQEKQRAIFEFVRDGLEERTQILQSGRLDLFEYPEDILKRGTADFEDRYLLLLTMLRAAGTSPDHVRFIAAEVDGNDNWIWVELYDGDTWWVLDPVEDYQFTDNPRDEFYGQHTVVVLWWFNDKGIRRG